MRIVPHPLLWRDIGGIAEHVHAASGDVAAARRRIGEVRGLIAAIVAERGPGTGLDGPPAGWRVRHGGGGRRNTAVIRRDAGQGALHVALVAFGAAGRSGMHAGHHGGSCAAR